MDRSVHLIRADRQRLAVLWALQTRSTPATPHDLCVLVDLGTAAMMEHLRFLEGHGYVCRGPVPGSAGKTNGYRLLPAGRDYVPDLINTLLCDDPPHIRR